MSEVLQELNLIALQSVEGFQYLQKLSRKERAELMDTIASSIEVVDEVLIRVAHEETNLAISRLHGEKARTINQWRLYADVVRSGELLDARIDNVEGKNDIRKYNIGLGPVVVFAASNFPFAFSTAGGDVASAIGAGCSVIFKEHSAHPRTSRIMADAIYSALKEFGAPASVFGYVAAKSHEVNQALVMLSSVKAVAFTGSFQGGMTLFKLGANRPNPIPVFAEMGSLNPVIALPKYLEQNIETFSKEYIGSLTLGTGQFCTNPGLLIVLKNENLVHLKRFLESELAKVSVSNMLHAGIRSSYDACLIRLNDSAETELIGHSVSDSELPLAVMYTVSALDFIYNRYLQEEVFGPSGLMIECEDFDELQNVIASLGGQLTITFAATIEDIKDNLSLVELAKDKCGRLLFNGMPTGVDVVYAMNHGGVFPSSSDSRFTSVGPDAMKRFLRPISFQNWPNEMLPTELQNSNPTKIVRIENNKQILPNI